MIKILEVDQWTSTGNVAAFRMAEFEDGSAPAKIRGGSSDAARAIFGGHFKVREVEERDGPARGNVWYRPDEDGKLKPWKWSYDSSG